MSELVHRKGKKSATIACWKSSPLAQVIESYEFGTWRMEEVSVPSPHRHVSVG